MLLNIKQAAEYIGVHPNTLRRWEKSGKVFPSRTEGNHRRYEMACIREIKNGLVGGKLDVDIWSDILRSESTKSCRARQPRATSEFHEELSVLFWDGLRSNLNVRRSITNRVIGAVVSFLKTLRHPRNSRQKALADKISLILLSHFSDTFLNKDVESWLKKMIKDPEPSCIPEEAMEGAKTKCPFDIHDDEQKAQRRVERGAYASSKTELVDPGSIVKGKLVSTGLVDI